jgi:hypothetical protein
MVGEGLGRVWSTESTGSSTHPPHSTARPLTIRLSQAHPRLKLSALHRLHDAANLRGSKFGKEEVGGEGVGDDGGGLGALGVHRAACGQGRGPLRVHGAGAATGPTVACLGGDSPVSGIGDRRCPRRHRGPTLTTAAAWWAVGVVAVAVGVVAVGVHIPHTQGVVCLPGGGSCRCIQGTGCRADRA